MATDPITIQVIANALKALIYEMDAAIERTSMSIIIREQHDFGMSLVDERGWIVTGTAFSGQSLADYARENPVHPGDVVVFNDPFISYGEISHLGDTMIAVPVFWADRIIAWGIAWGHHMDMGAAAPASMPAEATEIYHEGLQIPPVKLYSAGELNRDLLAVIARNSRTPEMMVGDLLALSAAGKIAEKRLHELAEKFGIEALLETFGVLFDRARETMRRLIQLLPDGETIAFRDVLDNDGVNDEPLTVSLAVTRRGERVVVDFTGTSEQCEGPVNFPLNPSHVKIELYSILKMSAGDRVAIDAELDPNQGIEDLVEVIIPEGCFLAPEYPAPVSLRHLAHGRMDEAIKGVFAQLFPDEIPATHNGSLNCYSMLGTGKTKADRWLCFEVMAAGSGGRALGDGLDAFSWNTRLKNAPVEFVETVYPVRIEQYSLRADSAGPGRHRGGDGLIRAIRTLRPARLFFLDDRHRTRPWGLHGGRAAEPNDAWLERADGTLQQLPSKFDGLRMAPGDMFVMRTGGGGGWGDPLDRDPERVLRDVRVGVLSEERARDVYGVVSTGESREIDSMATGEWRARMRREPAWIDRGEPVSSPGPGEFPAVEHPPTPWLVVPHRPA
ncbi:MAG: hydantoinase B/oxoprolinase family protein [Thermomicrobiales bacterium]|nr:hydantoinase B/oxoprolinase family protein [Thermomicrobiales bacterium]